MANANQIERIISDIKILDYYGKLQILEKLVRLLKSPGPIEAGKKHSLLELEGLGEEIWKDINVDEYIDQERNSWD
ncbi:MAG: hypothetical protein KAW12_27790 [Candidatus Aminicenantes bacterium]|nr:hypothetical protein [Candidatus Aminicenantes bacterium]